MLRWPMGDGGPAMATIGNGDMVTCHRCQMIEQVMYMPSGVVYRRLGIFCGLLTVVQERLFPTSTVTADSR